VRAESLREKKGETRILADIGTGKVLILGSDKPGRLAKIRRILKAPFRRFRRKVVWITRYNVCGFCGGKLSRSFGTQWVCESCLAVIVTAFEKSHILHHSPTPLEREQWKVTRIPKRVTKSMTDKKISEMDLWEYRRKSHPHGKNEYGVPLPCGFDSCGFYESSVWVSIPNVTWKQFLRTILQGDSINSPLRVLGGSSAWAIAQSHARQDLITVAKQKGIGSLFDSEFEKEILDLFENGEQRIQHAKTTILDWVEGPKKADEYQLAVQAGINKARTERRLAGQDIKLPCGHYVTKLGSGSFQNFGSGPGLDTRTVLCFSCYKRFRIIQRDGTLGFEEVKEQPRDTTPVGNIAKTPFY